jgi:hypothetical protein
MSEQATNITSTSAVIKWTLSASSTCEVEYGTTSSYGSTASNGSGASCSVTLSSLTAGTTYHAAVVANSAGLSFTGQDFTFTTPAESITLTGKTCAALGASSGTSATCTWSTAPSANETILCGADNNANSAMSLSHNASSPNTHTAVGSVYAGSGIPAYYQFFTSARIGSSPTTTTVSASTGNWLALGCISYTGGSTSPTDGTVGTHSATSETEENPISATTTTIQRKRRDCRLHTGGISVYTVGAKRLELAQPIRRYLVRAGLSGDYIFRIANLLGRCECRKDQRRYNLRRLQIIVQPSSGTADPAWRCEPGQVQHSLPECLGWRTFRDR